MDTLFGPLRKQGQAMVGALLPLHQASPAGADLVRAAWLSEGHTLPTAPPKLFWLFPKPSLVRAGSAVSHVGHSLGRGGYSTGPR